MSRKKGPQMVEAQITSIAQALPNSNDIASNKLFSFLITPPQLSTVPLGTLVSGLCVPVQGFPNYPYIFIPISKPTLGLLVSQPPKYSVGIPETPDLTGTPLYFPKFALKLPPTVLPDCLGQSFLNRIRIPTAEDLKDSGENVSLGKTSNSPNPTDNNQNSQNQSKIPTIPKLSQQKMPTPIINIRPKSQTCRIAVQKPIPQSLLQKQNPLPNPTTQKQKFRPSPIRPHQSCVETPSFSLSSASEEIQVSKENSPPPQKLSNYHYVSKHRILELWESRIQRDDTLPYEHPAEACIAAEEYPHPKMDAEEKERSLNYHYEKDIIKIPTFWPKRPWDKPEDYFTEEESARLKAEMKFLDKSWHEAFAAEHKRNESIPGKKVRTKKNHKDEGRRNSRNNYVAESKAPLFLTLPLEDFSTEEEFISDDLL